jgi:hypothetical protein
MQTKLSVLANSSGKLVAAFIPGQQQQGAPTQVTIAESSEHIAREVEMPKELQGTELSPEILQKYCLHVHEGCCALLLFQPADRS